MAAKSRRPPGVVEWGRPARVEEDADRDVLSQRAFAWDKCVLDSHAAVKGAPTAVIGSELASREGRVSVSQQGKARGPGQCITSPASPRCGLWAEVEQAKECRSG